VILRISASKIRASNETCVVVVVVVGGGVVVVVAVGGGDTVVVAVGGGGVVVDGGVVRFRTGIVIVDFAARYFLVDATRTVTRQDPLLAVTILELEILQSPCAPTDRRPVDFVLTSCVTWYTVAGSRVFNRHAMAGVARDTAVVDPWARTGAGSCVATAHNTANTVRVLLVSNWQLKLIS
jgi:hypothetical protein